MATRSALKVLSAVASLTLRVVGALRGMSEALYCEYWAMRSMFEVLDTASTGAYQVPVLILWTIYTGRVVMRQGGLIPAVPGARYHVQSWFERQAKQSRPQMFARWFLRVGKRPLAGLFLITRQTNKLRGLLFFIFFILEVDFNDIFYWSSNFDPKLWTKN